MGSRRQVGLVFGVWMVFVLLVAVFGVVLNVPVVWGSGTIYIRADGSIDPPTAPIQRNGDIYTLADNITSDTDGIVIERNNMTLDGEGYTVQGPGIYPSLGITLAGRSNVTIRNMEIKAFYHGIALGGYYPNKSMNNSIVGNNITTCEQGIRVSESSGNSISGNNITANNWMGIRVEGSSNNSIVGNNITSNSDGIGILYSSKNNSISGNNIMSNHGDGIILTEHSDDNIVSGNNLVSNGYGVAIAWYSAGNKIYHNNFINNKWGQAYVSLSENANFWDNDYPSGGNFWSNYVGVDEKSGPNQDQPGSDGIGDSPYVIDANNRDEYPLMYPRRLNFIYIRTDGAVDPPTSPIHRVGDVYTVTSSIHGFIVVEKDDILIDGAEYTVQGMGYWGTGIDLSDRNNITLRNIRIQSFEKGVWLRNSSYCVLADNNIIDNKYGVMVESLGAVAIERNEISDNSETGIMLVGASNVLIEENLIEGNKNGIATDESSATQSGIVIVGNRISENSRNGIYTYSKGHLYNVTLSSNTVSGNGEIGIYLYSYGTGYCALHDVTFSSNNVSSNGGSGIELFLYSWNSGHSDLYDITFSSNIVLANGGAGILLHSQGFGAGAWPMGQGLGYIRDIMLSSNNVSENGLDGTSLYSFGVGYYDYGYSYLFNVTLSSNTLLGNGGSGYNVYSESTGWGYYQGVFSSHLYNVMFSSNTVLANDENGIYLHSHGDAHGYLYNVTLSSNIVSANGQNGVMTEAPDHYVEFDLALSNNTVSSNYQKGIWIDGGINANLTHNSISYNTYGVFYSTSTLNSAKYNDIYCNSYGMNVTTGATVNATYNYWGDPSGSYHATLNPAGKGNSVNGNGTDLNFIPFLTAAIVTPDSTPPTTLDNYDGLWHATDFTITLTATDDLSGVAETYYTINDELINRTVSADGQPLITTEGADNKLEYWSVDNAGNEESHHILTGIKLDTTNPTIETPSRTPAGDVLPDQSVKVSVNATDAISGVKNVTLSYTTNDGATWTDLPMNYNPSTNLYETTIPPQPAGTIVKYRITAYDNAENQAADDNAGQYYVYPVVPELQANLILPLFMALTTLTIFLVKSSIKRQRRTHKT